MFKTTTEEEEAEVVEEEEVEVDLEEEVVDQLLIKVPHLLLYLMELFYIDLKITF